MTPSGATHMERATLPTRVALVPNVFAIQSVVYCAWHVGAIAKSSTTASKTALIRFQFMHVLLIPHSLTRLSGYLPSRQSRLSCRQSGRGHSPHSGLFY